jgi:hypothetical protein
MIAPEITVSQDLDSGVWHLYATSYGRTSPAGDRLLHVGKGQAWPAIRYECETQEEAERNATALRNHIGGWGKSASKQQVRKHAGE